VEDLAKGISGVMDAATATLTASVPGPLVPTSETTVKTPAAMAAVAVPQKRSGMAGWVAGGLLVAAAGGGVAVWKPWSQPPASSTRSSSSSATTTAAVSPPEKTAVEPPAKPPDEPVNPPATEKAPEKSAKAVAKTVAKTPDKAPDKPSVKTPDKPAVGEPPPSKPPDKPAVVVPVLEKMPETPVMTVETTPPTPSLDTANSKENGQDTPFKRGLEALRTKDYPAAVRHFTEVIGRRPKYGAAYYDRALAYQFQGDNTHAVQDYGDALRVGHRDVRTYTSKAICEVRLHQDDAALADFNSAIDIDAGAPGALNGRGSIFYRRKQYKLAIRDFSAAIKTNPEFGQAYENRANAKRMFGDAFGAADDFVVAKRLKQGKK
jgi:Tfp pilus assembly protein PilF